MEDTQTVSVEGNNSIHIEDVKDIKMIGFSKFETGWKFVEMKRGIVYVEWMEKILPWSRNCLFHPRTIESKGWSANTHRQVETVVWFYFNNRYPERGDIWYDAKSQKIFVEFIVWLHGIYNKHSD